MVVFARNANIVSFNSTYQTIKCMFNCSLHMQGGKHVRTTVSVDLPEYPPDPRITRADVRCTLPILESS